MSTVTTMDKPGVRETPIESPAPAEKLNVRALVFLLAPLIALSVLIQHFEIESKAFSNLAFLTTAGFLVHYLLPFGYRLPFFAVLSLAGIVFVLGVLPAVWIVGIGAALIGLCRARLPFGARVGLLALVGLALILMRAGIPPTPVPAPVWPILGSMFMFRLIVYLYDTGHERKLATFWSSIAYFFLLPNVCFPLFPVVDYKTFRKTYYNDERHRIYYGGLHWIARGVLQLILYRWVYQTLVLDPASVENVADLGQYLTWPFLLYLRVSGQFHIIAGMLRLFGFNLPETHHSYFLASSFTDFWRRINIYWKDFMMKLFYYPAYFALRKKAPVVALVASTCLVFAVTLFLHSYQWFWLRGAFQFGWNDTLFWTILGAFVVVNSLREWRRGRARAIAPRVLEWRPALALAARTVLMFCGMCLLWSLWSTESIATWLSLWSAAGTWPASFRWTSLVAIAAPLAVGITVVAKARGWGFKPLGDEARSFAIAAAAVCLVVASSFRVSAHLGSAGSVLTSLRSGSLNQADAVTLERGYYENLMAIDRFNGDLWSLYAQRPPDWAGTLLDKGLARKMDNVLPYELVPAHEGRFKGVMLRTNAWGMHDKEYAKTPPPGCRRIAVLGASHAMGTGVERERTFEALLEDRLNREHPEQCYEILNFAVYGYNALDQIQVLEAKALDFRPTTVLYVGHPEDSQRVVHFLAQQVRASTVLPYDFIADVVKDAGVAPAMPERVVTQRLAPFGERILSGLYRRIADDTSRRGACAGFVFMPMVPDMKYAVDVGREKQLAMDAGFVMLDLFGVYDVPDRQSLWVAEWDAHPNARGHQLVADRLHALILERESALFSCRANTGLVASATSGDARQAHTR